MGSGSTAIASLMSDRNFIRPDISAQYFDLAQKRIDDYMKKSNLKN